jgi:hypothetical protein
MADLDFDNFEEGYRTSSRGDGFGRLITFGGAALSLSLLAGMGLWGYQLAMRDVAGVPVIRALEGPMRLAPENPGGKEAMHQGLSVNALAAAGTALPPSETLVLAPRAMELAEEDVAGLVGMSAVDGAELMPLALPAALEAPAMAEVLPETQQDAVAMALAEALGEEVAPMADAPVLLAGDAVRSLRPKARGTKVASVEAVSTASPAAEVDPATIAAGTKLAQLGAFDDPEAARGEWLRLSGQFGDLMAGKAMVVQAAQSGGRTFFRLRAHGFADEDEARRFCTAMLAENATCIPVAQR